MKFNKFLLRILCLTLILAVACGIAAKLHVDGAEYKVEFDANGGTGVQAQYVVKGELATAPADPTREGYTFVGWFHNEDKWSFETPVKGAMVLVAHWEKLPAPCPHADKNDDFKCDNCGETFEDGIDLPAPTTYTITYVDGSEKLNLAPKSFNSESTGLVLPIPAAKAHLQFEGWYSDPEFTNKVMAIDVKAEANLVLYAKYVPVTYTVTYELDGGVNAETNVATYTVEDLPVSFAAPTKDAYEFKGWFTDANCTVAFTGITEENAGNVTLFAKWEKILIPHTITYLDDNFQVIAVEVFYESDEDQPIRAPYVKEGWEFKGWKHPRLYDVFFDCIPANTTEDMTVVAYMEEIINYHNVVYYINGVEHSRNSFSEKDGLAALLEYSKPGYTFSGWKDEGGIPVTSIPANTNHDVILNATSEAINYTVKFMVDGEEYKTVNFTVEDAVTAFDTLEDRADAKFVGWYDGDVHVTEVKAGTTKDIVLTAKFETRVYTITYQLGNDAGDVEVVTYNYGNVPEILARPEHEDGYSFAGWYTYTAEGKEQLVESIEQVANQDVVLFAKWLPDSESGITTPSVPFN